ncbi:MAG: response regulator transcription factor, partial [Cyanobacteria bacterium J06636_27]
MSDSHLKLLLIDSDPIFRLGLRQTLEEFPELQIVGEAETYTAALQILAELAQQDPNQVNLVVLEPDNNRSSNRQELGLQLIRQLRTQYPNLPILLLCHILQPGMLVALKAEGVNGYCPKGTPISELLIAMEQIAKGNSYWVHQSQQLREWEGETSEERLFLKRKSRNSLVNKLRNHLRESGTNYIKPNLTEVTRQLQIPGLTVLNKAILAGRRRELIAAQWLLDNLVDSLQPQQQNTPSPLIPFPESTSPKLESSTLTVTNSSINPLAPPLLSPRALQATLLASCINKLQFNLQNVTDIPLEIDILREDKKRELLYLLLQRFADSLDELRTSEVEESLFNEVKYQLLLDVWQAATKEYFGKFSRIRIGDIEVEIVNILLENEAIVRTEIIEKIPLITELLSYLIFQTELY